MDIKTKLSVGDTAHFIQENKAVSMPIEGVVVEQSTDTNGRKYPVTVTYKFRIYSDPQHKHRGTMDWLELPEALIHATKADLLASL